MQCGSVDSSAPEIKASYRGYWARTGWEWKFDDNKFTLTSGGEMGDKQTHGNFIRRKDSLFIEFLEDDIRPPGYSTQRKDTLLIYKGRCLISMKDGYDYCSPQGDSTKELHISTHH